MTADSGTPPASGSGCLKWLGIGCLVVVVLVAAGTVWAYYQIPKMAAYGLEKTAEAALEDMKVPPAEKEAVLKPIRDLAQKVRSRQVSWEQASRVMQELMQPAVLAALGAQLMERRFLEASRLPEEEKRAGHVAVTRFARGLGDKRIDPKKAEEVMDLVCVRTKNAQGQPQIRVKDSVADEDLQKCFQLMKTAADAAKVEDREFPIDIGAEIQKAIDRGMQGAAPAPAQAPAEAPPGPASGT